MKTFVGIILVVLSFNVALLYYLLFFGEYGSMVRRLRILETRVGSLATQLGVEEDPLLLTQGMGLTEADVRRIAADAALSAQSSYLPVLGAETDASTGGQIDVYIPIGSATAKSQSFNWLNVPAEATVSWDRLGQVKEVWFEAGLRVPTGNGWVEARLVGEDGSVIAGSELVGGDQDGAFVRVALQNSTALPGKLKLQMRTSMQYDGVVESARLQVVRE